MLPEVSPRLKISQSPGISLSHCFELPALGGLGGQGERRHCSGHGKWLSYGKLFQKRTLRTFFVLNLPHYTSLAIQRLCHAPAQTLACSGLENLFYPAGACRVFSNKREVGTWTQERCSIRGTRLTAVLCLTLCSWPVCHTLWESSPKAGMQLWQQTEVHRAATGLSSQARKPKGEEEIP